MTRVRLIAVVLLASGAALAGVAAPASAADLTTTGVACSPSPAGTGSATTCTVTVTDTAPSPTTPTGDVNFGSAPKTGTFGGAGACTLATATGDSTSCGVTFTPAAGGDYTITAAYGGDGTHDAGSATVSLTAVDPTTTSFTCTAATLAIDSSTSCSATVTDATSPLAPLGTVSFAAAPGTGTFGAPGVCRWQPSGAGGSATCQVTFSPASAGSYTLTATYSGDDDHATSTGAVSLTATTTPAGGGPAGQPGLQTLTLGLSNGPPPPGTLALAGRDKVSSRHIAAVKVSCAGQAGATCAGTLTLAASVKVKVTVKTTAKRKGGSGRGKGEQTTTQIRLVSVGSLKYTVAAGASQQLKLRLSRRAVKLLRAARLGRLRTTAFAAGSVTATVTLVAARQRRHKARHKRK
jgi:hypothetical protein